MKKTTGKMLLCSLTVLVLLAFVDQVFAQKTKSNKMLITISKCILSLPSICQMPANYCNIEDTCNEKLRKCHELSENEFGSMIQDGIGVYIGANGIKKAIEDENVDCSRDRLHVYIDDNGGLHFSIDRPIMYESRSYYSIALVRAIFKRNPTGFVFHEGINDVNMKVIPFIVLYRDKPVEYYNLSDTEGGEPEGVKSPKRGKK